MPTQRYSVTPHPIETLLTWVKSGEIAIPEIQRPFVWDAAKVRNLLDSLYRGYPVGYLIAWRNPTVRLKDGTPSAGKRILIDGQQRVTALMAALLGHQVLTRDYATTRITIAFHPGTERFEVSNSAIGRDRSWIRDVSELFTPTASLLTITNAYVENNPHADSVAVHRALENVKGIVHNHVGVIDLAEDLDVETVTEIFIRVNSAGAELSQADFVMSKIAADEAYGGNVLRKAIDYFCRLAIAPEFADHLKVADPAFIASEYYQKMRWLADSRDGIYDPAYTDLLRVAFTSEFHRGKLGDLVALLSGRNFATKRYEEAIAAESFARLRAGVLRFMNQTHFERLTMILRSAGFVTSDLIRSANAVNFAYILYLRGRADGMNAADLERLVRRWYGMSILRGRYTGNSETMFDFDMRQVEARGLAEYTHAVMESELPDSFWTGMLPQLMDTSSAVSPYFLAYKAAQVKLGDKGFLSRDITVLDLLLNRTDTHHIYPRSYLRKQNVPHSRVNQIANLVLAQSEINIAIGDRPPDTYFAQLAKQCHGGPRMYGAITDEAEMRANLAMNCIPGSLLDNEVPGYDDFLGRRRALMAMKIRDWFHAL